jgi:Esterase PHB depolymerase
VPGHTTKVVSLAVLLIASRAAANHDPVPVPPPASTTRKLQAVPTLDRNGITVSGLSSGAFFAHQFHVAYSRLVNGAGIIAGGPYGCVENIPNPWWAFWSVPLDRTTAAVVACTRYFGDRVFGLRPADPRADDSLRLIQEAFSRHAIDDPQNLADDRVWLFHGKDDGIVPERVVEVLRQVYSGLGIPAPRLLVDWNGATPVANHGMPVARFTGQSRFPVRDCREHEPPFVIQCGYEAAEMLLRHLYPETFRPASDDPHRDGSLIAFDQQEFFQPADDRISLHRVGYVFLPGRCAQEACRLHVAFHGCRQGVDSIHDDFIRDAGYNRWAAGNGIVVLYPQVAASAGNPNGCWDFWGYSGTGYYGQDGPQMRAVKAMVDRLLGP